MENIVSQEKVAFSIARYWFDDIFLSSSSYASGVGFRVDFTPKCEFRLKDSVAHLWFEFKSYSGENKDYFCKLTCHAEFAFKNVSNKDSIPDYFYANGAAILFPYLRAFVSLLTTQANFCEPVILPLLNFSGIMKTVKEETVEIQ